jgi:hypothetical protein
MTKEVASSHASLVHSCLGGSGRSGRSKTNEWRYESYDFVRAGNWLKFKSRSRDDQTRHVIDVRLIYLYHFDRKFSDA